MQEQRKIKQIPQRNEFGELEGILIPNYRKKEHFLTNPEYKLYKTLKRIYEKNENIEIFVQVALNQIIEFNNLRAKNEFSYFKLEERSIDFVIYNTDKNNIGIVYCIELNDRTHEEDDKRKERDRILKNMFEMAEIDLKFIKLSDIDKITINSTECFSDESIKSLLDIKED